MRIAVLGWGSLIWNKDTLEIAGEFERSELVLPLEFCRISNNGRLTLVVDDHRGTPCRVQVAQSSKINLDLAAENLRLREGKPKPAHIGRLACNSSPLPDHHGITAINEWLPTSGFSAVIWTALPSNFFDKTSRDFSVEAGIAHLKSLELAALDTALAYFRNAPAEVQTPLRNAVEREWAAARIVAG